jgi:hypothetical protein
MGGCVCVCVCVCVYVSVWVGVVANKHVSDTKALLRGKTAAVELTGASEWDYVMLLAGKVAHFTLVLGLPWSWHGAASLGPMVAFATVGSVTLAWLFAISHNLEDTKRDFGTHTNTHTYRCTCRHRVSSAGTHRGRAWRACGRVRLGH